MDRGGDSKEAIVVIPFPVLFVSELCFLFFLFSTLRFLRRGFAMKNYSNGGLTRFIGKVFFLGCALLAGCAQLINSPSELIDPEELGDGRVVIFIGAGPERTAFPRLDQISKVILSFRRLGGTDVMPPVEAGVGETAIILNPGTWEITASAYNNADPPVVAAGAANTLTRSGESITGSTYFALAPAGTGQGTLRYAITPPEGLALDPARSRIRIEKDGEALGSLNSGGFSAGVRAISGALTGTVSLDSGSYTVDIFLGDNAGPNAAAFQEAALILPGLETEITFTPRAEDFLDPDLRAVLSNVSTVQFGRTKNNSSRTVIGESGGGELNKTQALSVPHATETVYFTLTKLQGHAITIGGANAGSVRYATGGTIDGYVAKNTETVFTVEIPPDLADYGGTWDFTLALGETGKTPVVYTVTINLPFLTQLGVVWPSKWVYRVGEEFDPAGMELFGFYTDGTKAAPVSGGYTLEGFDTATVGERNVRIKKHGITGYEIQDKYNYNLLLDKDHFLLTVVSAARLVFDPELEGEHGAVKGKSTTNLEPPPSGYTVSPGRTLVLAPIKFLVPDNAVYEWKVDNAVQAATTEYLSFAYNAFGSGTHTVTVTAKVNGSPVASAITTVNCVSGAVQRPLEEASEAAAEKLFSVVAPGQFGTGSGRLGNYHGFGGYGGYAVFKFDHSVPKDGVDGKEIKIGGNTGVWTEPGAVWVSMDENNTGEPDDTWYELKGSHTFAANTLRRYAVTFRNDYTWTDNMGGGGTYPKLQGYAAYTDYLNQGYVTLVGTRLHDSLVGQPGVWGYADVWDDQTNSISNAVQVDGAPADLPFVDFVKIVTAIHYADPTFGERSTEAGTPKDMKMNDPEMMMEGAGNPDGNQFTYDFKNESGYDLIITFEGEEFSLPKKGTQTTEVRKTSTKAVVYIDYRGGNVTLIKGGKGEIALFVNGPEE
jgi:hypothetical protein